VKAARAVLLVEHTVTTPGSWVPDQPVLTATGREFIDGLKRRTARLQGIRCDGYTATWIPSPADPETLSLARAKLACAELHRKGLDVRARLVAHGRDDPIASNDTEAGRAANRRVAITFVHQLVHRPIR
jgi:OOP family OmpA-OmpF porin